MEEILDEDKLVKKKEEKVPKKRGRKPQKKGYFEENEEEAFRNFLTCENEREKNKIFEKQIYPALCKMVECIIRRYYLFAVDEPYDETFQDTLAFLLTKIKNFDVSMEKKAYSYCGTVCRRYLMTKRKNSMKRVERYLSYERYYGGSEKDNRVYETKETETLQSKSINQTKEEIKKILEKNHNGKRNLTKNEIKVGNALLQILDNWEDMIDDESSRKYNKLSLLFFIKEYTLCDTVEVRNAMKIYKNVYLFIKNKLINECL